jgi:hypothetical protein
LFELNAFDDAPGFYVEAGNDSHGEHGLQRKKNSAALNLHFRKKRAGKKRGGVRTETGAKSGRKKVENFLKKFLQSENESTTSCLSSGLTAMKVLILLMGDGVIQRDKIDNRRAA